MQIKMKGKVSYNSYRPCEAEMNMLYFKQHVDSVYRKKEQV